MDHHPALDHTGQAGEPSRALTPAQARTAGGVVKRNSGANTAKPPAAHRPLIQISLAGTRLPRTRRINPVLLLCLTSLVLGLTVGALSVMSAKLDEADTSLAMRSQISFLEQALREQAREPAAGVTHNGNQAPANSPDGTRAPAQAPQNTPQPTGTAPITPVQAEKAAVAIAPAANRGERFNTTAIEAAERARAQRKQAATNTSRTAGQGETPHTASGLATRTATSAGSAASGVQPPASANASAQAAAQTTAQAAAQTTAQASPHATSPGMAAPALETKVQAIAADKLGVLRLEADAVVMRSGTRVNVGATFSSGEKLISVDIGSSTIKTDRRTIIVL